MSKSHKAYELNIELKDPEDVVVKRTLVAPAGINFKQLHDILQICIGWYDNESEFFDFRFESPSINVTSYDEEVDAYLAYKHDLELYKKKYSGSGMDNRHFEQILDVETTVVDMIFDRDEVTEFEYEHDFAGESSIDTETQDLIFEVKIIKKHNGYTNRCPILLRYEGDIVGNFVKNEANQALMDWKTE